MCVVSNMIDSARTQWPQPQYIPYPVAVDLTDIINKLAEIDKKLGAKDCFDPKKDEYIQQLADRIKQLEAQQKKPRKSRV